MGSNLKLLIDRPDDPHVFRLHRDRVFYVSEPVMKLAASVARPNLIGLGVCLGKFSKTGKFRLHITALDYLAKYAKHKVRCSSPLAPLRSRRLGHRIASVCHRRFSNVQFAVLRRLFRELPHVH